MTKFFSCFLIFILLVSFTAVQAEGISNVQVGDYLLFGHYDQDNNKRNPPEPVEWQVLNVRDGKAMIISRHGLDVYQFDRSFNYPT